MILPEKVRILPEMNVALSQKLGMNNTCESHQYHYNEVLLTSKCIETYMKSDAYKNINEYLIKMIRCCSFQIYVKDSSA